LTSPGRPKLNHAGHVAVSIIAEFWIGQTVNGGWALGGEHFRREVLKSPNAVQNHCPRAKKAKPTKGKRQLNLL
jgi:hypothetical protein